MPVKKDLDWQRIEDDYRAGIKTLREIAAEHGIVHSAIQRRAKRDSWDRDLSQKIRQKAEAIVAKQSVARPSGQKNPATDREVVEAVAHHVAVVDLSHRADVQRYRELVNKLASELTQQIEGHEEFEDLGEIMASEATDKMREVYQRTIGFGGRTDNLKKLSDTLRMLVELERKILNLDQPESPADATPKDINVNFIRPNKH